MLLAGAGIIVYAALQGYRSRETFLVCDELGCALESRSIFSAAPQRLREWARGDIAAVRVERKLARGRGTAVAA